MDHSRNLGPIASNVNVVFHSFRTLFNATANQDNVEDLSTFEDESTRFKLWVGNLGAHQSGRASLDYRLREALHLQEQVVYLLKDISDSLQDALSLVHHEPPSWQKAQESRSLAKDMATSSGESLIDDNSDESSDFDENEPVKAGLSTQRADVGEAIDCLLRLSIAIANPAPHERFRKLGGGASEDVSFYETHDIGYVQDKYPSISPDLAEMLGKDITRRRQFFKYREAHRVKLAAGLDRAVCGQEGDTGRTEVVPRTVASSLPDGLKSYGDADVGPGVIDEDGRSEMGMSQTSYATSAGILMEEVGEDGLMKKSPPVLKVPPLPATAAWGPFECPFCYRMVSASNRAAWKRHVFGDLRPYTCVLPGCAGSTMGFDRRRQWQLHVSQQHWQSWSCTFQCQETFHSKEALRNHLSQQHLPMATEEHLDAISTLGNKSIADCVANECPFCLHNTSGLKAYIKHVGRHLEQIALFALPSLKNDNPDNEIESDQENVALSQRDSRESDDNTSEASANVPSREAECLGADGAIALNFNTISMTKDEIEELFNLAAKVLKDDYKFARDDSKRFFILNDKMLRHVGIPDVKDIPQLISSAAVKLMQILESIDVSNLSTHLEPSSLLVVPREESTKTMLAERAAAEAGNETEAVRDPTRPWAVWDKFNDDEDVQAAISGWKRYIENQFPVSGVQIHLHSPNLKSYLVETKEGFFIFSQNLRQCQLVSKTATGTADNLQHSPPRLDGMETLVAAESPHAVSTSTGRYKRTDRQLSRETVAVEADTTSSENPQTADSDHQTNPRLMTLDPSRIWQHNAPVSSVEETAREEDKLVSQNLFWDTFKEHLRRFNLEEDDEFLNLPQPKWVKFRTFDPKVHLGLWQGNTGSQIDLGSNDAREDQKAKTLEKEHCKTKVDVASKPSEGAS
ncbi:transcription factor [Fusarium albosuccineum]|uniref:Transcription factor n=1 Tax=Fusarium albosuccineum TaxID=1237068 RepID=A0A8H4L5K5_9HYPO|nr:transcription factor [Fusarium albosuccineum]